MELKKRHNQDWINFIRADQVPDGGLHVKLAADAAEREAVAARLSILAIDKLTAHLEILPRNNGHVLQVTGRLVADVVQACAVTLSPVSSHIEEDFSAWYADYDKAASFTRAQRESQAKILLDEQPIMEERDDPEPMIGGQIDAADLIVQYLSLALDPYPRAKEGGEGHVAVADKAVYPHGVLRPNPFAALKNWRPKD